MVSGTSLDFIIMHAGDFWTSVRILDFQDFQDFVIMHAAGNFKRTKLFLEQCCSMTKRHFFTLIRLQIPENDENRICSCSKP